MMGWWSGAEREKERERESGGWWSGGGVGMVVLVLHDKAAGREAAVPF